MSTPPAAWTVSICTSSRTAEATAPATVFGMSWNFMSRNTAAPVARIRRTMSGPAAVNSSLPILKPPTAGAIFLASSEAASAVGTSSAAMMGLRAMQAIHYDKPGAGKNNFLLRQRIFFGQNRRGIGRFCPCFVQSASFFPRFVLACRGMKVIRHTDANFAGQLHEMTAASSLFDSEIDQRTRAILQEVYLRGDDALLEFTE